MTEDNASIQCETNNTKDVNDNNPTTTETTPTPSTIAPSTNATTPTPSTDEKDEEFESDEFDSEWSEWKEILEDWFADIFDDLVSYASEDDGSELGFETDSDAYNSDGGYDDLDDWDDF